MKFGSPNWAICKSRFFPLIFFINQSIFCKAMTYRRPQTGKFAQEGKDEDVRSSFVSSKAAGVQYVVGAHVALTTRQNPGKIARCQHRSGRLADSGINVSPLSALPISRWRVQSENDDEEGYTSGNGACQNDRARRLAARHNRLNTELAPARPARVRQDTISISSLMLDAGWNLPHFTWCLLLMTADWVVSSRVSTWPRLDLVVIDS